MIEYSHITSRVHAMYPHIKYAIDEILAYQDVIQSRLFDAQRLGAMLDGRESCATIYKRNTHLGFFI